MKIYKYEIPLVLKGGLYSDELHPIDLPKRHRILSVGWNKHGLKLWALVDPEDKSETHYFFYVGTGQEMPVYSGAGPIFVGTVQQPGVTNPQVWHIFEGVKSDAS